MNREDDKRQDPDHNGPKKIDIIEERLVVDKEKVDKGKVVLHKRIIEEDVPLDLELTEEHIDVEVKKIGRVVDEIGPAVREEGDTKIYSVYREVYVKQTILEEEVRITRHHTRKPFHTSETLRREVIDVERISEVDSDRDKEGAPENRDRHPDGRDYSRDESYSSREDYQLEDRDRDNRDRDRDREGDASARRNVQGDDAGYNRQGDIGGYDKLKE